MLVYVFDGKVCYLAIVLDLRRQAGVPGLDAPRPALIPGDHQVIAFFTPCREFYHRPCSRSFPSPETQADHSVAGGEVGEAGQVGKVVSLGEGRQDQLPQAGGSSVQRKVDLPCGF